MVPGQKKANDIYAKRTILNVCARVCLLCVCLRVCICACMSVNPSLSVWVFREYAFLCVCLNVWACSCVYSCVCFCVYMRGRERERQGSMFVCAPALSPKFSVTHTFRQDHTHLTLTPSHPCVETGIRKIYIFLPL